MDTNTVYYCLNCFNNLDNYCTKDNEEYYMKTQSKECADYCAINSNEDEELEVTSACSFCDHNYEKTCSLFNPFYRKIRYPEDCKDFAYSSECDETPMESSSTDDIIIEDDIDHNNDENDRIDYLTNN